MNIYRPTDLKNMTVAVSVSQSEDLGRLGLAEDHLRLALGEIARTILVHNGTLMYGGHLLAGGYTPYLVKELERYGNPDRPLVVCLPWSEHATMGFSDLANRSHEYGLYAIIRFLDIDGCEMRRVPGPPLVTALSGDDRAKSLTSMRRFMTESCDARVLLGGKVRGFQGAIPGLIEEALFACAKAQPLFLAGGFGGATLELLRAVNPDLVSWFPAAEGRVAWAPNSETRTALENAGRLWRENSQKTWVLGEETLVQLSATHRASEIATVVGQGLARINAMKNIGTAEQGCSGANALGTR